SNYVLEILKKYGMESCDPVGTPMEIKDKLDLDQNGTLVDATKYRSMIGALMYLTSSRPDIDSGFELTGFSDADYAGCKDSFKSTFGGAHFLGEKRLTDYGFHLDKIPIYCDSKSAIAISCNPVQHSRTKHIAVRYHFIKEHVEKGTIELYFVKTDYQLADIFTKALPTDRFNYLAKPTEKYLKEVKRIFRYLRGTINTGLWYTKDTGFELTEFLDADYAGCKDSFKSTFGGAQFLAKSTPSRLYLTDYGFNFTKIPIYCDSKSAIAISCNPVQHSRTKHIAVRYHFIKEDVEKGTIELYFVKTDYQLADIFTKSLPADRFNYLVRRLGMRSLSPKELERLAKS
nr:retrotransposon protein, putative, unclassified [Tanacetum cinerariifolium]